MKKFVLCTLLASLMMPVAAQEKLPFNNIESKTIHASEMMSDLGLSDVGMLPINPTENILNVSPPEGWTIIGTSNSYDRQTQGCVYPMTQIHDDGFIGCTWTNEDNPPFPGSSTPLRGIGYSYSTDGGSTWSVPDMRVGGIPIYWPSYAQWGANGEAILGRSADTYNHGGVQIFNGLVLLTRPNKGQGEWTIHTVPYPAGTPLADGWIMAWARMITSGENHQYIHIMTHTRNEGGPYYQGYREPVFYYRTSNGGATWDHAGVLLPEAAGISWHEGTDGGPSYTDQISMAQHGNVIAASFVRFGYHNYVLKSLDNGNTWTATQFFYSSVRYYGYPSEFSDICYVPTQGYVAVDNNGKVHVAFGTRMVQNSENEGYITSYTGWITSFLSYWNEDMATLDGYDYIESNMENLIYNQFIDYNLSYDNLYVKSTTPVWPIIGFYTPTLDDHYFYTPYDFDWLLTSYGNAGLFSFPQMEFDKNNILHLTYLGILDGGYDGNGNWLRHPYYTTCYEDGTWTDTEYLVNYIYVIDREFAYLTSAGINNDKMYLMAQTDQYAGVYTAYAGQPSDHGPTTNYFYHFYIPIGENDCLPVSNLAVNYSTDCSEAELTWTNPTGNPTCKIYRDNNLIATVIGQNSYTDSGFNATVSHTWKIIVVCADGESYPKTITKPACDPCNPVTNLTANYSADCSEAELTWTNPTGNTTCKIYRDNNLIATVTGQNSYIDNGFNVATGHTWKVTVVCMGGESTPVSVTKPVCTPCSPVTNLAVDYAEDCSKAVLTWNAPAQGNFTYNVYRDDNLLATIVGQNTYTDKGFNAATGHTWKVTVVCTGSESLPVSVTKDVCNPCNPVTDASATITDCETATIIWTAVTGAVEYKILIDGNPLATLPGTTTSITYTATFEHEKTYEWSIVTVCTHGESEAVSVSETANCVGINELSNSVAIYPNPVSGMITINATGFAKVEVYNTIGQLIETRTVNTFDVSSYNTGVYFFKVYDTDNNNVTKRVMVTK